MNKQGKIDFINEVFERFDEARNHGGRDDWWHPTPFTIAYNVKMSNFISIRELRGKMSFTQNEFYLDDFLEQYIWEYVGRECDILVEDIKESFDIAEAFFAGRSGGWLEVRYKKNISPVDKATPVADIGEYYDEAKKLEALEAEVAEYIEKSHADFEKRISSGDAANDIIEVSLFSDEEIKKIYKDKIKKLQKLISK